jgi:hypothetical protein
VSVFLEPEIGGKIDEAALTLLTDERRRYFEELRGKAAWTLAEEPSAPDKRDGWLSLDEFHSIAMGLRAEYRERFNK